jgi:putative tricarboxylic transport membrane protein
LLRLWVGVLRIPKPMLYAAITVVASLGAYSVNGALFDVGLMYLLGVAGFFLRTASMPLAPAVIGFILGPIAEQQLRRALAIGQGSPSILVERPISAALIAIAVLLLVVPPLIGRRATHVATP